MARVVPKREKSHQGDPGEDEAENDQEKEGDRAQSRVQQRGGFRAEAGRASLDQGDAGSLGRSADRENLDGGGQLDDFDVGRLVRRSSG